MSAIAGIDILQLPPYMKVPDIKKYFGWDRYKVWKLLKEKRIRGSRPGKEWLVNTASVLKLLKKYENVVIKED